jgi:hypothetical protein
MRIFPFFIRHFLPIGLIAALGMALFSAAAPADSTRVDGFGIDMSALPALTTENVEPMTAMIGSTGAEYITQEINWSQIESSPDVYNWSAVMPLDQLVSSASSHEIKVVAVLTGGPIYLAASGQPVDRSAFGERWEKFVQAAVEHFGESVNIWQIGSAINSSYGLSPFLYPLSPQTASAPDTAFYANLLRSARKIIKNADPNDLVWMGSLVGPAAESCAVSPLTFMLEMNASKAWKSADAVVYQPRQGAAMPEVQAAGSGSSACSSNLTSAPTSITGEVQAVQELARQLGGKPVIIDGLEWNASDLGSLSAGRSISTGQLEADLLVRASTALMAQNTIQTIIWHTDISGNPSAKNALTNLNQSLADFKPMGQLQGMAGVVHDYRFRKGGKIISLAWRIQEGDTAYPVVLAAEDIPSFTAYAADAPALTAENGLSIPANASGEVVVMLNERPVIFIGRSSDIAGNTKLAVSDQMEMWQMEIKNSLVHLLNDQKAALMDLLDQWFEQAKESAIEWGEGKLDELLP